MTLTSRFLSQSFHYDYSLTALIELRNVLTYDNVKTNALVLIGSTFYSDKPPARAIVTATFFKYSRDIDLSFRACGRQVVFVTMAMALDAAEIERRLGYSDSHAMDFSHTLKNKQPSAAANSVRAGEIPVDVRNYRKLIRPCPLSKALMRQISGLGMEDPVFGTKELGPEHPSQIFEDMDLNDLPEDMRDMVSIASDPTARDGDGLDMDMFQQSMGDLHCSISDFSFVRPVSPSVKSVETSGSSSTRSDEERRKQHRTKDAVRKPKHKEDLHASLRSLELEEAIFGVATGRPPKPDFNNSRSSMQMSKSTVQSRLSEDSNNLVMEAALALQKQGSASEDLILAALSQSFSELNCSKEDLFKPRKAERRASNLATVPNYEAPSPGSPEAGKARFNVKARAMPSIASLYETPRIKRGGRRQTQQEPHRVERKGSASTASTRASSTKGL